MTATAVFTPLTRVSPRLVLPASSVVTSRTVAAGADYLDQVVALADALVREPLALGRSGRLVVDRGFTPSAAAPVTAWSTTGRLHVAGFHLAKVVRVELELSEHSAESCLLELRPVSQNVRRWGKWRYDRYFNLAHRAADALSRAVAR